MTTFGRFYPISKLSSVVVITPIANNVTSTRVSAPRKRQVEPIGASPGGAAY